VYLCHLTDDLVQMFADAMDKVFTGARTASTVRTKPSVTRTYAPLSSGK
jgi:hypothetical protein